jgi:hypothetical protein
MDRERMEEDTLPSSLQSLHGEYEGIREIRRTRRTGILG